MSVPGNNIYIVAESFQQVQKPSPPPPPPVIIKAVISKEWHVSTVTITTTQHEISTTTAISITTAISTTTSIKTSTATEWKFSTVTNTKTEHIPTTITEKGAISTQYVPTTLTEKTTIVSTKTDLSISPALATKASILCGNRRTSQWETQSDVKLSLFDTTVGIRCCSGSIAKVSPEEIL